MRRNQRQADGSGAGHGRGDAGDHLHPVALCQALEEVEEGAVEEGIALAEHRDVLARIEARTEGRRRFFVNLHRRKASWFQRHANGEFLLPAKEMGCCDAAGETLALGGRGIGHDLGLPERLQRLERDQVGIAGADADTAEQAAHPGLTSVSCVTGMSGRQAR